MFIKDDIVYASKITNNIEVKDIQILDDMMMLVLFSTGEKRLFDATQLLNYPAFKPLEDSHVFKSATVEHGVVVWNNGEIDIAPETMYRDSFEYQEMVV